MEIVFPQKVVKLVCEDREIEELPEGVLRLNSVENDRRCNRWTDHRRVGLQSHALVQYELWECIECKAQRTWGSIG